MVTVNQTRRDPSEILAETAARARRLHTVGLIPTDEVRALRPGRKQVWMTGAPHDVTADGSVTCILNTQFRTLPVDQLEVKRRGPRGGIRWVPITPTPEEAR